jgi:hypothetical protein
MTGEGNVIVATLVAVRTVPSALNDQYVQPVEASRA